MKRSTLARALVGAILFLTLGGPAPGAVGSCGSSVATVDAKQFCATRRAIECDRTKVRQQAMYPNEPPPVAAPGCIDDPLTPTNELIDCNHLACRMRVLSDCASASWPDDCNPPPNEIVATACTDALANPDNLPRTTAELIECNVNTLCPPPGSALSEPLLETDVGAIHESPAPAEGI